MFKKYDKTCPDCVSSQVKINSAVNAELRKELVSAGEFVQTKKMVLLK